MFSFIFSYIFLFVCCAVCFWFDLFIRFDLILAVRSRVAHQNCLLRSYSVNLLFPVALYNIDMTTISFLKKLKCSLQVYYSRYFHIVCSYKRGVMFNIEYEIKLLYNLLERSDFLNCAEYAPCCVIMLFITSYHEYTIIYYP